MLRRKKNSFLPVWTRIREVKEMYMFALNLTCKGPFTIPAGYLFLRDTRAVPRSISSGAIFLRDTARQTCSWPISAFVLINWLLTNTTEMKMLRWMQGKTRKDHIRNTTIRENAHVEPINTFLTKKRLSWFGHVQRREEHNIAKYVLATQVPGSRPRGRPKLRWMDRIKQDMKENNICPECATDRESWFIMIRNVNPTTYRGIDGKGEKRWERWDCWHSTDAQVYVGQWLRRLDNFRPGECTGSVCTLSWFASML